MSMANQVPHGNGSYPNYGSQHQINMLAGHGSGGASVV